jgi:hypothetical protein
MSLAELPPARRLAVGLFLLCFLGFYLLAQVKILTSMPSEGPWPGPREILAKYHGDPTKSRFHEVLDPSRPTEDPKSMFAYAGTSIEEQRANRAKVLAWVEEGMPRHAWKDVEPVFTGPQTCGQCHVASRTDANGQPFAKADLPFETYEQVVSAARVPSGMTLHDLATSSHNHMWGFTAAALLLSLVFTCTRWRGAFRGALIAGSFLGASLDVGSWWLTHDHGHPFEWGVLVGGALFGTCTVAMAALSLDELWLRGRVGAVVAAVLRPLGFTPRAPHPGPADAPGA